MSATDQDWTKPAAMAIPKEGYFEFERGRYGPVFARTPACYGFSIIAKVKEGREDANRQYGKNIQAAITETPDVLAPLQLHYHRCCSRYGRWQTFQYQGIFDTDFDKYTEDAVALFGQRASTQCSPTSGASRRIGRTTRNRSSISCASTPSRVFWNTASTRTSADEIKKALRLKAAFSTTLDQMQ